MKQTYIIASLLLLAFACGKKQKTVQPTRQPLIEAVYASGSVSPQHEYKVYAIVDGILTQKLVQDGDKVKANQPLFKIESDIQKARADNAKAVYGIAKENVGNSSPLLNEARIALQNARLKYEQDSATHARYKNLYDSKIIPPNDYEKFRTAYLMAKNEWNARAEAYKKLQNQTTIELRNAESQYKISAKDEANYWINSRIDGMVYKVYTEIGEAVRRNEILALVGDSENIFVKLSVDELDIVKVKAGQEVLIKIDIYKDKVFKAKITKVYPYLEPLTQSFRVDAEFVETPPTTLSGLTVEANIVVNQKASTLVIPKAALATQDSVWINRNGNKEKIKITRGIENFDWVEVLGGIDENTEIIYDFLH